MKIVSVNVGKPKQVLWQGKEVLTSIFKYPVDGPLAVKKLNIAGDEQADLSVHGGLDKAIYAFSFDTYAWWQKTLGLSTLEPGAFGENLTLDTLDESKIFVGDVFAVGSCELQAVQPRQPCFKLGIRFGDMKILKTFNDYHRCGVYFRVLKEGQIQAGDSLQLIRSEKTKASISELFQFYKDKWVTTPERARELLQIPSMNESWREAFAENAES